ncbi:MAG: hypothetical protein KF824_00835 [Fimbriimonadaceae bacterium]|nr:MAG: hypothetical protein KF824_00835 [Fimbriimonadaceae bacterium]
MKKLKSSGLKIVTICAVLGFIVLCLWSASLALEKPQPLAVKPMSPAQRFKLIPRPTSSSVGSNISQIKFEPVEYPESSRLNSDASTIQLHLELKNEFQEARRLIRIIPFKADGNNTRQVGYLMNAARLVSNQILFYIATNDFQEAEKAVNDHVAFLDFCANHRNKFVSSNGRTIASIYLRSITDAINTQPTSLKQREFLRQVIKKYKNIPSRSITDVINYEVSDAILDVRHSRGMNKMFFNKKYADWNITPPAFPAKETEDWLIQYANSLQTAATYGADRSPEQILAIFEVESKSRPKESLLNPLSVAITNCQPRLSLFAMYATDIEFLILNFNLSLLDYLEAHGRLPLLGEIETPIDPYTQKPMKYAPITSSEEMSKDIEYEKAFGRRRSKYPPMWSLSTDLPKPFKEDYANNYLADTAYFIGGVPKAMLKTQAKPNAVSR